MQEIENIRRYSPNTIKSYKTDLKEFAKFFVTANDKLKSKKLTERFVKVIFMLLSEKDLDKKTISRKLSCD